MGLSGRKKILQRKTIPLDKFSCLSLKQNHQEVFGGIEEVLKKEGRVSKGDWVFI